MHLFLNFKNINITNSKYTKRILQHIAGANWYYSPAEAPYGKLAKGASWVLILPKADTLATHRAAPGGGHS